MMNVSTGALCAENGHEVARLLDELSQIDGSNFAKICPLPVWSQPENTLKKLIFEFAATAKAEVPQCADSPLPLTPTDDAPKAAEGAGNSQPQRPNTSHDTKTSDTYTPSKSPARAAGSRTGKGKVGRKPRLSPLTGQTVAGLIRATERGEALDYFCPTATDYAAARLSKMPKRDSQDGPRKPRVSDAVVETFWHLRWEDLSPAQKLTCATWHFASAGGRSFSLNLSAEREAELRSHSDPRGRMAKLLRDHLRAAGFGELPIAWVFELTPIDAHSPARLHLHGVIGGNLDFTEDELSRLDKALCEAGGDTAGAIGGERQNVFKPLSYAPGWASYMLEDMPKTAADLRLDREALIYLSNPARRAAEAHFQLTKGAAIGSI